MPPHTVPWDDSQPRGGDKVCEGCIEGWLDLEFGLTSEDEERMEQENRRWREVVQTSSAQK